MSELPAPSDFESMQSTKLPENFDLRLNVFNFRLKFRNMEKFIIELKDISKRNFLLELLAQFDFIELEIQEEEDEEPAAEESYDFFQSAGLFTGRKIDADKLRREAWGVGD